MAHFEDSQFEANRADGWRKLKNNAVPTLFNFGNPPQLLTFQQMKRIGTPKPGSMLDGSLILDDHLFCNVEEGSEVSANPEVFTRKRASEETSSQSKRQAALAEDFKWIIAKQQSTKDKLDETNANLKDLTLAINNLSGTINNTASLLLSALNRMAQ